MIPNAVDFQFYPRYLEKNFQKEEDRVTFLSSYLYPLLKDYDYIFLDVPLTLSLQNDTAFYFCDQIVVILQTQERSLTGAEMFIKYLSDTLIEDFNAKCDVLGVLPVLSKRKAAVDEEVLRLASVEFGPEYIFKLDCNIKCNSLKS
nr:AAA family ATPase [Facklamia lactis]